MYCLERDSSYLFRILRPSFTGGSWWFLLYRFGSGVTRNPLFLGPLVHKSLVTFSLLKVSLLYLCFL